MDQTDTQLAQGAAELFKGGLRGLAGQLLRLFDQGADPIGLTSFGAGSTHPFDHFEAAAVSHQHGVDRGASGRQLI
ncbi:hypothetical protein D3C77_716890 [compost metagenome]